MRPQLNGKVILKGIGHFTALKSAAKPGKAKADLSLQSSARNERF